MALAKIKKLDLKKETAKEVAKKVAPKIKQISDDELRAKEFLEIKNQIAADSKEIESIREQYDVFVKNIIQGTDAERMAKDMTKIERRLEKRMQSLEVLQGSLITDLRAGQRSLFFELKEKVGRASTKYKEVCENIVDDKKVTREVMDEYYDKHTSRKVSEILLYEGKEVDAELDD